MNINQDHSFQIVSDLPLHPFEHLDNHASHFCVQADVLCWEFETGKILTDRESYVRLKSCRRAIFEALQKFKAVVGKPGFVLPDGRFSKQKEVDALQQLKRRIEKLYQKHSVHFEAGEVAHEEDSKPTVLDDDKLQRQLREIKEREKALEQDGVDTLPTNINVSNIRKQAAMAQLMVGEMDLSQTVSEDTCDILSTQKSIRRNLNRPSEPSPQITTPVNKPKRRGTLARFVDGLFRRKED